MVVVDVQRDRLRVLHILLLFHHLSHRAQFLAYQFIRRRDHKFVRRYQNGDAIERVQCRPVSGHHNLHLRVFS